MTKTKLALLFLKQAGSAGVHSFDLNRLIGTTRCAARVQDLKDQGYDITSVFERKGRSWGVRYFLRSKEEYKPSYKFDPGRQVFVFG